MPKTNNKGFSLVELIVVIAIMAVLIAVLAPSFLRYVEQSRVASDKQTAAAIVSAVQVWSTDVNAGITPGTTAITTGSGSITVTASGASISGDLAAAILSALNNAGLPAPSLIKCQSRTTWSTGTQYRIDFTAHSDGNIKITYHPAELGVQQSTNAP